jgi:hypothetical protein
VEGTTLGLEIAGFASQGERSLEEAEHFTGIACLFMLIPDLEQLGYRLVHLSPSIAKEHENRVVRRTGATGLEPATSGVTGRRSNQLNYAPEGRTV